MEEMARHVHEEWMRRRLKEGWRLEPERNDARREHPCLVPYDELPEIEKEYDRATARETLRFIVSQGYEIRKKEVSNDTVNSENSENSDGSNVFKGNKGFSM